MKVGPQDCTAGVESRVADKEVRAHRAAPIVGPFGCIASAQGLVIMQARYLPTGTAATNPLKTIPTGKQQTCYAVQTR